MVVEESRGLFRDDVLLIQMQSTKVCEIRSDCHKVRTPSWSDQTDDIVRARYVNLLPTSQPLPAVEVLQHFTAAAACFARLLLPTMTRRRRHVA